MKQKKNVVQIDGKGIAGLLVGAIVVLLLLGWIQTTLKVYQPETVLGILMAQVIVALMILLFIMAAGFSLLGLSDSQQALGLPEGSIRAMIALFLIMIFVTFGLYLFNTVDDQGTMVLHDLTSDEVQQLGDKVILKSPETEDKTKYQVTIQANTNQEGVDIAKQLINTVGTLVVAVAGFYFGTRAVQVARGVATSDEPRIRSVDPTSEEKSKGAVSLSILGEGFMTADTVKLKKGAKEYTATEVISNASKIVAQFNISDVAMDTDGKTEKDTKFDLIVVNKDGAEDRLGDAFIIKPASQTQSADPNAPPTPKRGSKNKVTPV